jgi:hypothetical protein
MSTTCPACLDKSGEMLEPVQPICRVDLIPALENLK